MPHKADRIRDAAGKWTRYVAPPAGSTPTYLEITEPSGTVHHIDIDQRIDTRDGFGALEAFAQETPALRRLHRAYWAPYWREVCHLAMFDSLAPKGWRIAVRERS